MDFINALADHLAEKLNIKKSKIVSVLNTFPSSSNNEGSSGDESEDEKKTKIPKKVSKQKTNVSSEVHKCERVKRNQTEPCGKNARRSVVEADGEEHWYCGGEKSGCYPIALKQSTEEKVPEKVKSKEKDEPEKSSKAREIVKKMKSTGNKFSVRKHVSDKHGRIYLDLETKIIIDKTTQKATGKYDQKHDKILKLDEDDIRFLEANKILIDPEALPETSETSSKDSKKSSQSNDESGDESEDELDLEGSGDESDSSDSDSEESSDSDSD